MQKLRDVVRMKVDELRMARNVRTVDQREVVDALANALASRSSAGSAGHSVGDPDSHHGAVHMCPWHTCQATHHG